MAVVDCSLVYSLDSLTFVAGIVAVLLAAIVGYFDFAVVGGCCCDCGCGCCFGGGFGGVYS